jgi:transposase
VLSPERVLIVALDIGKDVHVVYARTAAGCELLPPTKLATRASGWQTFTAHLDAWLTSGAYALVRLGHEPTGVYHDAWSAALLQRYHAHCTGTASPPLHYRLLIPNQVKAERQRLSHRRRKSDAIDAAAMASLLADDHGTPLTQVPTATQVLRLTLASLRQVGTQQMHRQVALLRLLDRLWPGALGNARRYQQAHPDLPPLLHLVDTRPLERQRVRVLLEHCPDPHAIRNLGTNGIQALFRQHGVRCGEQTARRVVQVFEQAVLLPPDLCAALARQAQRDFQRYVADEEQVADLEAEAMGLLPQTSGQVLTTLPGSSPMLAARYLAGIGGDATRFPSAKQLWSYAGYDPIYADSGNGTYVGRISHQGSAYLRGTLFQLGFLASLHAGATARVYVRARERGLGEVPACIHAAHQVNQVCYALLTTQQPYHERLSDAEAQRWRERARAWRKQKTRQRAR